MNYTITITATAINVSGGDFNGTAVGAFSYSEENGEQVKLSSFAGQDIAIDFANGDTAAVNGGAAITNSADLITALDAVTLA